MKDLSRNISLLCPTCGNDQFSAIDVETDDLSDAPDETRVKCSDCGMILTKAELIEENQERINANIDDIKAVIDSSANLMIISSKMPFEFLDAGKNFEEHLIIHGGTADKFLITTTWEDADGQTHTKEQMGSL